jgi:hypothetical protein
MTVQVDLLYNISVEHELVTEAIVAFDHTTEVAWPLDGVNDGLQTAYRSSLCIPHISVKETTRGEMMGYVISSDTGQWIVDYDTPFGPNLPVDALNEALGKILSQEGWDQDMALYLYPVSYFTDPPGLDGLWIADTLDGVGDDPDLDDVVFHMVCNDNRSRRARKKFPQFQPRRFTI